MEKLILCLLALLPCILTEKSPAGISEHQYCEGCISTVKELMKKLTRKTDSRELLVMDSMERICSPHNFVSYEYSPPRTVKACKALLEKHEEDIESFLIKDGKDAENKICYEISKACTGVDRTKKPKDLGDIDLTSNKDKKVEKVVDIDPTSGKGVPRDGNSEDKEASDGGEENKAKTHQGSGKTLSKKDKKSKKAKSKKEKKTADKPKATEKPKAGHRQKDGVDYLNVDINDPNSIRNVMEQINQIKKDHEKKFNEKLEEEERQRDEL